MRGFVLLLLLVGACPHTGGSFERATNQDAPAKGTASGSSVATGLPTTSESAPSTARPSASVPAAPADKQQPSVAATQLCVEPDGTVVVDNDCGCNDALLCTAELAGDTVSVLVRTDPSRMRTCDDCFAMVPGRCALPANANGKLTIRAGALALRADVLHGKLTPPQARTCVRTKP